MAMATRMNMTTKNISKPDPGSHQPSLRCDLCPRLSSFRSDNNIAHPEWFNGPVPSFAGQAPELLIVGLAPGLQGANRTGRPFTGDYAGDLLYASLLKYGFASGRYDKRPDDGLVLHRCRITNAVRCVPPQNKPLTDEIKACRPFLKSEIESLTGLKAVMALGRVAHDSLLTTFGLTRSHYPFSHGGTHALPGGLTLCDSYHCSRYNTNTGRLTEAMFHDVINAIKQLLDS